MVTILDEDEPEEEEAVVFGADVVVVVLLVVVIFDVDVLLDWESSLSDFPDDESSFPEDESLEDELLSPLTSMFRAACNVSPEIMPINPDYDIWKCKYQQLISFVSLIYIYCRRYSRRRI